MNIQNLCWQCEHSKSMFLLMWHMKVAGFHQARRFIGGLGRQDRRRKLWQHIVTPVGDQDLIATLQLLGQLSNAVRRLRDQLGVRRLVDACQAGVRFANALEEFYETWLSHAMLSFESLACTPLKLAKPLIR